DVPERLVDPRDGAHHDDATLEVRAADHPLPEAFDLSRILTEEQRLEVSDRTAHSTRVPAERRLAPTHEARLVGAHADEHPVAVAGVDDPRGDVRDLHAGGG